MILGPQPGAVQTHNGAKQTELEPPDQQLTEFLTFRIPHQEPSDITVPPGNSAHSHGKTAGDALAQGVPVGHDIPVPHRRTVFLAAGICRPGQGNNLLLSLLPQTVIKHFYIIIRIKHGCLGAVSQVKMQMTELLRMHLRLRLVQPEIPDPLVIVVLLYPVPHKGSGIRIHGINKGLLAVKIKGAVLTVFCPHQHIGLAHSPVIFAFGIDGGPDGHNGLDSHFLQLLAHGRRVRPIFRVKLPLALLRPVEIVDDNGGDGNSSALVLPGHLQKLLLAFIPQLTLPEAGSPVRKPGGISGEIAVNLHYICRLIPCKHKVIDLISAFRAPQRVISGGLTPSRGGIVPEKAVAQRRIQVGKG